MGTLARHSLLPRSRTYWMRAIFLSFMKIAGKAIRRRVVPQTSSERLPAPNASEGFGSWDPLFGGFDFEGVFASWVCFYLAILSLLFWPLSAVTASSVPLLPPCSSAWSPESTSWSSSFSFLIYTFWSLRIWTYYCFDGSYLTASISTPPGPTLSRSLSRSSIDEREPMLSWERTDDQGESWLVALDSRMRSCSGNYKLLIALERWQVCAIKAEKSRTAPAAPLGAFTIFMFACLDSKYSDWIIKWNKRKQN